MQDNEATKKKKLENIKQINSVLELLSKDDDLHDDFKMPEVLKAINHWTGIHRLPIEEAGKLQDHRRIVYVLQRFQMLQHVCKAAGIQVPLDLLIQRKTELSSDFIKQYFHIDKDSLLSSSTSDNSSSINSKQNNHKSDTKVKTINNTANNKVQSYVSDKLSNVNNDVNQYDNSYNPINQILKFSIAIVFILIAITLSYLPPSFFRMLFESSNDNS